MTKEELEKEAYKEAEKLKEYQTEPNNEYEKGFNNGEIRGYKDGYRDGAELREKQIQIDAKQIRALQKQNGELTDENERLKGDLELWESGACRATNLDKCSVVKELEAQNLQLLKEWREMDKAKQKAELKVAELMGDVSTLEQDYKRLEAQIEKMKSDVREEIGFAKNFNELHTYSVLNNLLNGWEMIEK